METTTTKITSNGVVWIRAETTFPRPDAPDPVVSMYSASDIAQGKAVATSAIASATADLSKWQAMEDLMNA